MKRTALLFLCIILILTCISSCIVDDEVTSSAADDVSVDNWSNELSAPINIESVENISMNEVFTDIKVSDKPNAVIISKNAPYTKSEEADERSYPDTYSIELTDGITNVAVGNYSDESLSGYTADKLDVTLDLGGLYNNIYQFQVGYYATNGAGIGVPWSFTVSASIDGENWKDLGELTPAEFVEGAVCYATLILDNYINARYVRFTMKSAYPWMFLDEVIVVADIDEEQNKLSDEFEIAINDAYHNLGTASYNEIKGSIDRSLDKILISQNKNYTSNATADSRFPDKEKMLTDGKTSGYYEGGTWVGFVGGKTSTFKINLGKVTDDVANIEASFFVNTDIGIFMPVAIEISAIDNKNNRIDLGVQYGNTTFINGNYNFVLPLRNAVTAKYIEFTIHSLQNTTFMIEELAVYAYRYQESKSLYPDLKFDFVTDKWEDTENSEYCNLILGKAQQIFSWASPAEENFTSHYNTPVSSTLMTNGQFATENNIHNGNFFKFSGGSGRKVIYDLEKLTYVDKFTASFTHLSDWAVYAPGYVFILISENGQEWYNIGELILDGEGEDDIYKGELMLQQPLLARYVAFDFVVKTWAGCDELEVYGKKTSIGAISASDSGYIATALYETERKMPSNELLGGSKDLCLLYVSEDLQYTNEDLLPYLAYIDKNGTPEDIMFDSFLFLSTNEMPIGSPQTGSYKSDWEWYIELVFSDTSNITAMENTAGEIKNKLGLADDFKYKVTLTLYYPSSSITDFGDVDGDGISEDLSVYENRLKVTKWYIDEIEKRFKQTNFKNIELVGYYWWHEDILSDDADLRNLIIEIGNYVRSVDKNFFWIPWFTSPGFNLCNQLGFDVACMQPNYVFRAETDIMNIINCAQLTETFGMGIEMEIQNDCLRNMLFFEKYMEYMAGGIEYGYSDAVNMYYQSEYVYRDAAYSKEIMARTIYDVTYHYIKGDLEYIPKTIENRIFKMNDNDICMFDLDLEDYKLREFSLYLAPEHGSVTMNNDGTFVYFPEEGFKGTVTFSYVYTEYLGWSEPCVVEINIE